VLCGGSVVIGVSATGRVECVAGVCPLNGDSSCLIQKGLSDASKIRSLALRGKQKSYAVCACVRACEREETVGNIWMITCRK